MVSRPQRRQESVRRGTDFDDKQMTEDEAGFLNSLPLSTSDDIWPSSATSSASSSSSFSSSSSSTSDAVDDRIIAQLRYIPR